MSWSEERTEIAKKLWAEGLSASLIAGRLGGVSRNAVIGKIHRLGLAGRSTTTRTYKQNRKRVLRPKANVIPLFNNKYRSSPMRALDAEPYKPAPAVEVPESERKTLADLAEKDCRYPYGDGPFTFCARAKVPGLSYCADHARVAFMPLPSRSRETSEKQRLAARRVAVNHGFAAPHAAVDAREMAEIE